MVAVEFELAKELSFGAPEPAKALPKPPPLPKALPKPEILPVDPNPLPPPNPDVWPRLPPKLDVLFVSVGLLSGSGLAKLDSFFPSGIEPKPEEDDAANAPNPEDAKADEEVCAVAEVFSVADPFSVGACSCVKLAK